MIQLHIVLLVVVLTISRVAGQVDRLHCRNPLGMQDKRIPDSHLSASSRHADGTGPMYGRLEREEGYGAWCPKGLVNPEDTQYLEIKLIQPSFLTIIATQGRYAKGDGQEYLPNYKLNYSRDGVTWFQWRNFRGDSTLQGNTDTRNVKKQLLNPGIPSAQYVRIIAATSRPMSVCLRLELYGCPMISRLVSYDMPKPGASIETGTVSGDDDNIHFDDDSYDGRKTGTNYFSGLGQLTDGFVGDKDLSMTKSQVQTRKMGYDYVGWSNNKRGDRYVTITFHFEDVRNFTNMRVHCVSNSNFNAKFFSNVQVSFSLNGRTFTNSPYARKIAYDLPESSTPTDNTRFVVVPLGRAMARYVRARFQIRGAWMLISEIEFDSESSGHDPNPELMYPEVPTVEQIVLTAKVAWNGNKNGDVTEGSSSSRLSSKDDEIVAVSTHPSVSPTNKNSIGVIVGTLAAVIALLALIVILLLLRQRRMKKTMTPPRYTFTSVNGASGTTRASVTLCIPEQQVTLTPTSSVTTEKCGDPVYHEIAGTRNIMLENGYLEPNDVIRAKYNLPEVTQLGEQTGRDRRFEQPDVTLCTSSARDGVMPIPHYAETDVRRLPPPYATPLQGVFGNNVYAVPWTTQSPVATRRMKQPKKPVLTPPPKYTATPSEASTLLAEESSDDARFQSVMSLSVGGNGAIEFPRERLEFIEQLGEGQFGEVRLCEADPVLRKYVKEEGIILPGDPNSCVRVAVKVLREDASENAKEDFLKEVKVMSQLRDSNIVQLLAVCTEDEPFAMITEYMERGDLNQYLKGFDIDESTLKSRTLSGNSLSSEDMPQCSSRLPTVSCSELLKMAAQIASGMKYLASLNFVHRDLATRNCLVGTDHKIRIADFGMSRNMYQGDYYKIQGKAVLPIRWMSWECILLGKFSTSSDVWAYGVTLWEIFTLCKCQPYHALEDKQVIENMHHIYGRTGEEVYLPKPKACPTRVFNMVRKCWRRECHDRPTFDELHSFLLENI